MPEEKPLLTIDPFLTRLQEEREVAYSFQKRRHEEWNETYQLYRDRVEINRLTQRQAVNIPLMKETIKTLLSRIDEGTDVAFQELSNDLEKEYVLNEFWNWDMDRINFDGKDIQDKKQVLLYGRSFIKLNFLEGMFDADVLDIYDVLVDPKTDPLNIESARYIVQQNIMKPLQSILQNAQYDEKAKDKLQTLVSQKHSLLLGSKNRETLDAKQERMELMGAEDEGSVLENLIAGADVIVSLAEHYTTEWDKEKEKFVRYVAVVAEDSIILFKKPLKQVLGVDFWPFVTWTGDIEITDFWSDGEGDIVRIINKVINAWFSQGVENRTYRNFGMRFFDATNRAFNPKSFTPEPWGFYPVPGNPNDILKEVEIQPMTDGMAEINWLINIAEKATATPAVEKGAEAGRKTITLGEVEMLAGKAMERVKGMAKFYKRSRKELAEKWLKIIDAGMPSSKTIKLFKASFKGNIFEKDITASDWKSRAGYKVKITSSSEQDAENLTNIQRLTAIKNQFPENLALQRIIQKRFLDLADMTPDEVKEIQEFEKQRAMMPPAPPTRAPQPPTPLTLPQMANI